MSGTLLQEWPTDRICVLRMNRPEVYNALDRALLREMLDALAALPGTAARVLILAANGPGFCAGADLKERRSLGPDEKYQHNRMINALAEALASAPLCTIAAIGGAALGGGLEIALACDLRFAATTATLGLTEARVGAIPGAGGTQRLPRLIGTARALEMMYAGDPIPAARAEAWGLVNGVAEPSELEAHVLAYAGIVAQRSRRTAALLKSTVYGGLERDLSGGLELERLAIVEVLGSDDYREGLAAFAERRRPVFD
jgi:enoyl-CoA hydratase/carnithine racemase